MSCNINPNGSVTCCAPGGPCTTSGGPTSYPPCSGTMGQCPCAYAGCMDPSSTNYSATATCDDGSCIASVVGCQDPLAVNYNSQANTPCGGGVNSAFSGYSNYTGGVGFNPKIGELDYLYPIIGGIIIYLLLKKS